MSEDWGHARTPLHDAPKRRVLRRLRTAAVVFAWVYIGLALIGLSTLFDRAAADWARDSGLAAALTDRQNLRWLADLLKWPGEFAATLVLAALIWWRHPSGWRGAGFMVLATAVSGINGLVKWVVGRTRPFKLDAELALLDPMLLQPFRGGWAGLFVGKNLAFPSGHACLAFANAAALGLLLPRGRWAFYVIAAVTAFERVAENAHYVSDVVAGAVLGVAGVYLVRWVLAGFTGGPAATLPEPKPGSAITHERAVA